MKTPQEFEAIVNAQIDALKAAVIDVYAGESSRCDSGTMSMLVGDMKREQEGLSRLFRYARAELLERIKKQHDDLDSWVQLAQERGRRIAELEAQVREARELLVYSIGSRSKVGLRGEVESWLARTAPKEAT